MEQNSYINYQSSNFDFGAHPNSRQPTSFPAHMNPFYNEISSNGLFPPSAFTDLTLSMVGQPYENNNRFHNLPPSHRAVNFVPEKILPTESFKNVLGPKNSPFGTGCSQKQFYVFDQSCKQTTMLYSCKIGIPVSLMDLGDQNQPCIWRKEDLAINKDGVSHSKPLLVGELDENQNDGMRSDMHEDTEELNALLYSDDDDGDDEETSTAHSPSNMSIPRVEDWLKSLEEEVASSVGSTKRKKLLGEGHNKPIPVTNTAFLNTASSMKCVELLDEGYNSWAVPSTALLDFASSMKCVACPGTEHDTESGCGNAVNQFSSFSAKKRSRKEDMHKTIRILQKVVPDSKGKDTMDIIDEAIHYLESLKSVAKDIGLAAF